jgi:RNA polymerase sigma-70 factor (ECF subfamily)
VTGLRHLRDSPSADDLVQQVLITALQLLRAGGLREPEKLASFVLGTCRMTVLNQRRGVRRRQQLLDQFGLEMLAPVPSAGPRLDHEKLANCVQGLKERERAVIVMSFYDRTLPGPGAW